MNYLRGVWLLLWLISCSALAADKPNIILIVLDDWSVGDAGFYGNPLIETPTIDRLAREGVVMQQAYAAAPSCAPSRAALMTGLYPHRNRIIATGFSDPEPKSQQRFTPPVSQPSISAELLSLPRWLKQAGYHTALIGKWNLGNDPGRGPHAHGFDINIGGYRGGLEMSHFAPYPKLMPNLQNAPQGEYMTTRLSREVVSFIRQQQPEQPFFLYFAHYAPHAPWHAPEEDINYYEAKAASLCTSTKQAYPCDLSGIYFSYAAMMKHVDQSLQDMLNTLNEKKLLANTRIILTSDNGGYRFDQPFNQLRGQKSELYEGGIRVPLIFWNWGAHGERNSPVSLMDILPTLASMVGEVPKNLDGENIAEVIEGKNVPQRLLYWFYPLYTADIMRETSDDFSQRPALVVRQGQFKYIRSLENGREPQLYNLVEDPAERRDLHAVQPALRQQFDRLLDNWFERNVDLVELYKPHKPPTDSQARFISSK